MTDYVFERRQCLLIKCNANKNRQKSEPVFLETVEFQADCSESRIPITLVLAPALHTKYW